MIIFFLDFFLRVFRLGNVLVIRLFVIQPPVARPTTRVWKKRQRDGQTNHNPGSSCICRFTHGAKEPRPEQLPKFFNLPPAGIECMLLRSAQMAYCVEVPPNGVLSNGTERPRRTPCVLKAGTGGSVSGGSGTALYCTVLYILYLPAESFGTEAAKEDPGRRVQSRHTLYSLLTRAEIHDASRLEPRLHQMSFLRI